jgi:hypothetical protein
MKMTARLNVLILFVALHASALAQRVELNTSDSSGGSTQWTRSGDTWEQIDYHPDTREYGARPEDNTLKSITVVWKPLELDALGHLCRVRGQLRIPTQTPGHTEPINWFQGVSIYLAMQPDTKLDWTNGIDLNSAVGKTDVVNTSGEFSLSFDLRDDVHHNRKLVQSFQFGLALATHADGQRVHWTSRTPAIPASLAMLSLPAARPLSRELELIDAAACWPFSDPKGVELIRAVNALRPLGKDQALATLEKYVELTKDSQYTFDGQEIVFWIIRLLFEPIRLEDRIPSPAIAVFLVEDNSPEAHFWPLNPIELVEGIPFMVGRRIGLGGHPEHPSSHIQWARRHGVIRDEPLIPTKNPLAAAEALLTSPRFRQLDEWARESGTDSIRSQALAMIGDLVKPLPKKHRTKSQQNLDWADRLAEAEKLQIHWDPKQEKFGATK